MYIAQQLKGVGVVASDEEGPGAELGMDAAGGERTPHGRILGNEDEVHTPEK